MRITQQVMVGNMMKHLQQNASRLDKINQQLATGKKFQWPSEAPIEVTRSMQLSNFITGSEKYQGNIDQAMNWLNFSETAVDNASEIIHRARELAIYAANEVLTEDDMLVIAKEIEELKEEVINIANSKMGNRYLFSGQATSTVPFDSDGNYQGDYNSIQREVGPGIKIAINFDGEEVFREALDALENLQGDLEAGDNHTISSTRIGEFDDALDKNLTTRARIGAKLSRLELSKNRFDDEIISLKTELSETEDVDLAEAIIELKMEESVYRAALGVGARIIQPTLMDFLR